MVYGRVKQGLLGQQLKSLLELIAIAVGLINTEMLIAEERYADQVMFGGFGKPILTHAVLCAVVWRLPIFRQRCDH